MTPDPGGWVYLTSTTGRGEWGDMDDSGGRETDEPHPPRERCTEEKEFPLDHSTLQGYRVTTGVLPLGKVGVVRKRHTGTCPVGWRDSES